MAPNVLGTTGVYTFITTPVHCNDKDKGACTLVAFFVTVDWCWFGGRDTGECWLHDKLVLLHTAVCTEIRQRKRTFWLVSKYSSILSHFACNFCAGRTA